MLFPLSRLICILGLALLAGHASAQDTGKSLSVDESKLPEWVKRQAASPQKFIINSAVVRAKAEPAKPEVVPVRPVRQAPRRPSPPAAEPTTAAEPGLRAKAPAEQAPPSAPALVNALDTEPTEIPPATAAASAPAATQAVELVPPTQTPPAPSEVAVPAPAPGQVQPAPVQPEQPAPAAALVLLDKVDPVLTPDLIDGRLPEASVTVAFTVGTQGEVINPQITATTDRRLNRSVLRAVAEWHYAPVSEPQPHSVKFTFAVTP